MKRTWHSKTQRLMVALAALTGCIFASGFLPSCETTLTTVNPCGSIFGFCDPIDVELLFADLPDFGRDPSCTIPYFGVNNPGGAGGGGGGGGAGANVGECAEVVLFP